MPLKRNQKIYAFVGSAGERLTGGTAKGGYNGGGQTLTCIAGAHSASGGGATHISWSHNPITVDEFVYGQNTGISLACTWNGTVWRSGWYLKLCHNWSNPYDCIAIAGGGGGDGSTDANAASFTLLYSYGGGEISAPSRGGTYTGGRNSASANNYTHSGYSQGAGQYAVGDSGAGGGWYGGYSTNSFIGVYHVSCYATGGGGTSHIREDYTGFQIPGNDPRVINGAYMKPVTEGINGYIKVMKQ